MSADAVAAPRAEKSSNFFFAFLFLPKHKREALSLVYAYCRIIDDIVDDGTLGKDEARRQLDWWSQEVERLYKGQPTHPVTRSLAPFIERFALPREPFDEMIRGCSMDLDGTRYEDIAHLETYMKGVAVSVGELSVRIFGFERTPPERMAAFARDFGYAFQLTNIIRDVGADLALGRVYLPEADLAAAGYTRAQLERREHGPAFTKLMRAQYDRAKAYYRRARSVVDPRDRPSLLPAEVMAHIYEGLLDRIAAGGFQVLAEKQRLPAWKKAYFAGKAWIYCHGKG